MILRTSSNKKQEVYYKKTLIFIPWKRISNLGCTEVSNVLCVFEAPLAISYISFRSFVEWSADFSSVHSDNLVMHKGPLLELYNGFATPKTL